MMMKFKADYIIHNTFAKKGNICTVYKWTQFVLSDYIMTGNAMKSLVICLKICLYVLFDHLYSKTNVNSSNK